MILNEIEFDVGKTVGSVLLLQDSFGDCVLEVGEMVRTLQLSFLNPQWYNSFFNVTQKLVKLALNLQILLVLTCNLIKLLYNLLHW